MIPYTLTTMIIYVGVITCVRIKWIKHQYLLLISGIPCPSMSTSIVNAISTIVHVVYKEFANYTFKIITQIPRPTMGNLAIYDRISSHIHIYPDMYIFIYIDIHAIHWYIYIDHMHAHTYIHTIHTPVSIAYAYQSIITLCTFQMKSGRNI